MPTTRETLDLEELVITVYAALDDAVAEEAPPFSSSTPIRSMSAAPSGPAARSAASACWISRFTPTGHGPSGSALRGTPLGQGLVA